MCFPLFSLLLQLSSYLFCISVFASNYETVYFQSGVSGQDITGLVIAKQEGRQVTSKNGEERGAMTFTIRDKSAIVNVTCWGTLQFIQQLAQK